MRKICRRRLPRKSLRPGNRHPRNPEINLHGTRNATASNDEFGAVPILECAGEAAAFTVSTVARECRMRSSLGSLLPRLPPAVVQLVLRHLPAECVAVNSQKFGGPALIAVGSLQNPFDESFFEFTYGFIEQNPAFHHLSHKAFQLISHVRTLSACNLS